MQTPAQRMRALIDQFTKAAAAHPELPTGKDGRMQEEAVQTGAVARALASMRTKKQDVMPRTVPIARLQRKSY